MANGNGNNPFDLVDDFKDAGFQQKQAEVLARVLVNLESQNAATKQDLEVAKLELKREIADVKLDIENVKSELKRDIENVKSELKRDIKELEARMKLHMIITSGGMAFLILGSIVTLAQLGLLTPTP